MRSAVGPGPMGKGPGSTRTCILSQPGPDDCPLRTNISAITIPVSLAPYSLFFCSNARSDDWPNPSTRCRSAYDFCVQVLKTFHITQPRSRFLTHPTALRPWTRSPASRFSPVRTQPETTNIPHTPVPEPWSPSLLPHPYASGAP